MNRFKLLLLVLISMNSMAQTLLPPGFPDRAPNLDALPGFKRPPSGYGDVGFYWWIGDTLTRERIEWQLDELKNKKMTGLQINYCHTDAGGATYGLTFPSQPVLFSKKWWELFNWFLLEGKKRGMSVSLSDYTLGAAGQGWYVDEMLLENPQLNGSKLESKQWTLAGGKELTTAVPANLISLTAYPEPNGKLAETGKVDLRSAVQNSELKWMAPSGDWKIIAIYQNTVKTSFDPMNPLSGAKTIEKFYQRFEDQNPGEAGKGLNFFFSDELQFGIRGLLWNDQFAAEFKRRKGYDILPELPNLFAYFGLKSYKIRLDYNDVMVGLSEENFFKPLYDWHTSRGMLFGCDHGGRGRDLTEFGDYFRTQRWMSGPGSDQPHLRKDLIKAKVAASIAHMYERPRVWLEGFYGSGWGTSSADVTDATFANFNLGYNLLSLHGLYYTTKGGWWEWAPPCNHFHMPYWKQIDPLMNCVERLSYLMSQGHHRCDVAVMYPTEPVVADLDGKNSTTIAFGAGTELYSKGIDFDYMDYESLARAEVKDGELHVAGEKFKVLIIPSMKVMRHASLQKIEAFKNAGGIVVNIGAQPVATDLSGVKDAEVSKLISNVYAETPNLIQCKDEKEVVAAISGKYIPDFKILSEIGSQPYVIHRIIGGRDVYALYNLPAGTKCFFKAKGNVELWNPWTTEISSLSNLAIPTSGGTEITLPLSEKEMQLVVFSRGSATAKEFVSPKVLKTIPVEGEWGFELKPSLDNQWGDFQLPAAKEMLGAQVRQLYHAENKNYTGSKIKMDESWKKQTCAYGKQFLKLGVLPVCPTEQELAKMNPAKEGETIQIENKDYRWTAYGFSWQHGVEGDFGHQGYHGLKGQMYDNFIRLGKLESFKHSLRRAPESEGNFYVLSTAVIAPSDGTFDILSGDKKPALLFINGKKADPNSTSVSLKKGANPVLLVYDKACETYLVFRKMNSPRPSKQEVSMCWYQDYGVLPYDAEGAGPSSGLFAFESAPGLQSFTFSAYGNVQVWSEGVGQKPIAGKKLADGLTAYQVKLSDPKPSSSQIVLKIDYEPGYRGMAAIPAYIRQSCGTGILALGDWSEIDGLKAYSGGALYRKSIAISADDVKNKLELDLGDLVSSAELFVNGKSAGIHLSPPWKFDVTSFAKPGENKVEVMIYNTLANNYTTIPTSYRGSIKSGLIGPVQLKVLSSK
jgi:hypothetical protein